MEQHNLSITATHTDLIICNSLNTLNTLSADVLSENENLVLDLETAEVSALSTSEEEFLIGLAES